VFVVQDSFRVGNFTGQITDLNIWNIPLTRLDLVSISSTLSRFCASRSPKCKKIQLSHQYLLTLLGPTSVKALRRTLMKLSPGVNFINNLWAAFIHHDRADLLCTFGICAYQLHLERWWNWLQETYSLKCNQSLLEQNKVIDWEKLKNFRQGNLTRIVSKENTDACLIDQGNKNKFYWIEWIPLKNVFANKDFFRFFL